MQKKSLNIVISPTDYCNMNCIYCYNQEKRDIYDCPQMSLDMLEHLFAISLPDHEKILFIWHGGEPLSMGNTFFEDVLRLQEKHNINGCVIENRIQTNLTLLNDELASYLTRNSFLLGSSFDGLQNKYTRHHSEDIIAGINLLKKYQKTCGVICVVSQRNIDHLIEDYEFFNENNISYALNPYFSENKVSPLRVEREKYVAHIEELFDHYFFDEEGSISIRPFETIINYLLFKKKSLCTYTSCLGKWLGIHPNGDIYPCNRVYSEEYKMGNIQDYSHIADCFQSSGFELLVKKAIKRRNMCKTCSIYDFCEGGCNNNSAIDLGVEKKNEYMCYILGHIYGYISQQITDVLKEDDPDYLKINPQIKGKILMKYNQQRAKEV